MNFEAEKQVLVKKRKLGRYRGCSLKVFLCQFLDLGPYLIYKVFLSYTSESYTLRVFNQGMSPSRHAAT